MAARALQMGLKKSEPTSSVPRGLGPCLPLFRGGPCWLGRSLSLGGLGGCSLHTRARTHARALPFPRPGGSHS